MRRVEAPSKSLGCRRPSGVPLPPELHPITPDQRMPITSDQRMPITSDQSVPIWPVPYATVATMTSQSSRRKDTWDLRLSARDILPWYLKQQWPFW